jgi:hypothetical protein
VVEGALEVEGRCCGLGVVVEEAREGSRLSMCALVEGEVVRAQEVASPLLRVGASEFVEREEAEVSSSLLVMQEREVALLVY